jgi:hypothetical protein
MHRKNLTREAKDALVRQIREAVEAGDSSVTLDFAGSELTMQWTPDGDMTVAAPGWPDAARVFAKPATRPDDYPADLPFVPGATVIVTRYSARAARTDARRRLVARG